MESPPAPAANLAAPRRTRVAMLVLNPYTHDTRVEKEAATLRDGGYQVTIVASAAAGLPTSEERDGIRVVRVRRVGPAIPGLRFMRHARRLERALVATEPDVLHAHDSNALLPVAWAARRLAVPFVYDAHDLWTGRPRRDRSRIYFAASQLLYRFVEARYLPMAAAHLTVSEPIARYLERAYRLPQVRLVPNYPSLAPVPAPRDLRAAAGPPVIPADAPVILYLGGLMAQRGIEQLVTAIRDVPAAHLVLLGAGALDSRVRGLAAELGIDERVHLLDPVASEEVVAYAASATIGVSPIIPSCLNYRYSLPNKLFQYMAAAIPVVASDFPQVRTVVAGSDAGLLVDMSRPGELAEALRVLLADPGLRVRMGENGRAAYLAEYNWTRSADALLEVYDRVTGRRLPAASD